MIICFSLIEENVQGGRTRMSKADLIFKENCKQILEHGFSTEGQTVRAKWEDGTPAHTIKTFGVVNRYDLQEEFPMMTLRYTNWKNAIDEILWTHSVDLLADGNSDQTLDSSGLLSSSYLPRALY